MELEQTRENNLPAHLSLAIKDRRLPENVSTEIVNLKNRELINKVDELLRRRERYDKNLLRTAIFALKKRRQMKQKLSKLNDLTNEGILMSTIWDIGKRDNYAGDPSFYGNAPTQVVEQCILRLTKKGETILDAMAGSGTTIDVCKKLGRKILAYDLNPTRRDIKMADSISLPLKENSVDMVFFHPPYLNMVKYSKNKEDLSNLELNQFLMKTEQILKEHKRILKRTRYITILVGDLIENGTFIPLTRFIANIAEKIGLKDCGYAIKITSGSVSQRIRGKAIYAEMAASNNLKVNHDTIMFFKKI